MGGGRRSPAPRLRRGAAAVLAALALLRPAAAAAGYLLAPGDTVELVVAGLPDLASRSVVDVDGLLHFPLIPAVPAGGRPVAEVEGEVRRTLPARSVRRTSADGRQTLTVVSPDEITLRVAEYRPVYVTGDVAKPGEEAFRPGLSVRQAVALAGGYDVVRFRMGNPVLEASDLRATYETLWVQLARLQAHAATLKAALSGSGPPDLARAVKAPIPASVLADIVRVEADEARARAADHARERDYLVNAAAAADAEAAAFAKPRLDAQAREQDEAEFKRKLDGLVERGVVAHPRVADQQRSLLDDTQRFLDYSQRISDLQRSKASFTRQAERLDDQRRIALLKDLQDVDVEIAGTQAKLSSVGEKLLYTGAIRSQLVRGTGAKPDITIHHAGGGEVAADEDTILTAGDTVSVSLRAELSPQGVAE